MPSIKAFVGHSFDEDDKDLVQRFLCFFESLKGTTDFEWDHAEKAEAKGLSKKVKEKMEGKNLFIGIFTKKDYRIKQPQLKKFINLNYANTAKFAIGTSEWIIQESGYAIGKGMKLLFLVEDGVKSIQGLAGDHEYISFKRKRKGSALENRKWSFTLLLPSMICILCHASTIHKTNKR